MCALLCFIMLFAGLMFNEPTYFVAAGLFAIGAEIASINYKREKEKKDVGK